MNEELRLLNVPREGSEAYAEYILVNEARAAVAARREELTAQLAAEKASPAVAQ